MADNKKYYYMRLKDNFFNTNELVLLESMQDGYLYSNILLKLYLLSLKDNGKLMFNDRIPYNSQMIATITKHQIGTVEKALTIFKDMGLIEVLDTGAIYMLDIQQYIGKSSTEADRIKSYRQQISQDSTKSVQMYNKRTPEIEKEIDIELEKDIEIEKELDNEPSVNALAPIIGLPLNDNTLFPITQEQFNEYKNAYQNVDVMNELQKMKVWLNSNPTKRKTKKGILRFVNSWLAKEQDKPKVNYQKPVERVQPVYHQEQQTSVNREELLKSIKESLARM